MLRKRDLLGDHNLHSVPSQPGRYYKKMRVAPWLTGDAETNISAGGVSLSPNNLVHTNLKCYPDLVC